MPTDEIVGGLGGEHGPSYSTTRDVRLLARALSEHWDIPLDVRQAVLDRLGGVVKDPQARLRAVLAASKVLVGLSRLNLAAFHQMIECHQHEEIQHRVKELEKLAEADKKAKQERGGW